MTHKQALIEVLAIVKTIPGHCLGSHAEDIFAVTEQLADPDCTFAGAPPFEARLRGANAQIADLTAQLSAMTQERDAYGAERDEAEKRLMDCQYRLADLTVKLTAATYIGKVGQNPAARDIKRADLADNLDPSRHEWAKDEASTTKLKSLMRRYELALSILEAGKRGAK